VSTLDHPAATRLDRSWQPAGGVLAQRVTTVIQQRTGHRYHPGHTWKLLRRMGWRLQRPTRRAVERDEQAIARWVAEDWPRIRANARRRRAVIVFWDESGTSLLPVTRRPGRPAATPRHRPPFQMEAGVDGRRDLLRLDRRRRGRGLPPPAARLQLRHPHRRLGQLRAFLGGQKATLVWDWLPAHRSLAMRHCLGCQRSWLVVEPLSGYAPDLNPVEGLWANLKATELANLAAGTLAEVTAAERGVASRVWWKSRTGVGSQQS
jgi:Winged helix-turn helix